MAPPDDQAFHATTFASSLTTADIGKAVMVSGGFTEATGITVVLVTEDEPVLGRLDVVESDGRDSIADEGYLEFLFTVGVTPSLRQGIVGGATPGTVKSAAHSAGGRGYNVSVDRTNLKVLVHF